MTGGHPPPRPGPVFGWDPPIRDGHGRVLQPSFDGLLDPIANVKTALELYRGRGREAATEPEPIIRSGPIVFEMTVVIKDPELYERLLYGREPVRMRKPRWPGRRET